MSSIESESSNELRQFIADVLADEFRVVKRPETGRSRALVCLDDYIALILGQLKDKFGPLPKSVEGEVRTNLRIDSVVIAKRILVADTLEAALGPLGRKFCLSSAPTHSAGSCEGSGGPE